MKVGKLIVQIIKRYLKASDKRKQRHWPDMNVYEAKLDVDALGDGVFAHQIDVYYAPKEKRTGRVLIDIHGGSYVYSYRKNNRGFASVFLEKGYDVVLLDYDQNNFGHGCDEQLAVLAKQLAYLHDNAASLDLDRNRFFLVGDSAGGHFALLLATLSCSKELQEELGYPLGGFSIHALALSCPVYDFERTSSTPVLAKSGRKYMFGPRYGEEGFAARISPKTHLDKLTVPFYLTSCHNDFIKQESLDLDADATRLGIPHEFRFFAENKKSVSHVFNIMDFGLKESIQANDEIDAFFAAHD